MKASLFLLFWYLGNLVSMVDSRGIEFQRTYFSSDSSVFAGKARHESVWRRTRFLGLSTWGIGHVSMSGTWIPI